jgi:thioredoxin reductase (NADPH)
VTTDLDIAFPTLTEREIDLLRPYGRERDVPDGTVLFAEGDRDFCFFVVLEGEVAIIERSSGEERQVAVHPRHGFTGDVDMLTGRAAIVSGRMLGDGRVLEVSRERLRRVVGEQAELSERLLKAFLMRRTLLLADGFEGMKIIGSRFSPQAHRLRDFATRNAIPFTWLDLERDDRAETLLREFGIPASATPVVVGRDGQFLTNPSVEDLASCAGLDATLDPATEYDLVVVGAGPAGLAASVYAASEGLRTLTLDAEAAGGQAGTSSRIENYLGFPAGISGAELTRNALLQAQKFGATVSVPGRVRKLRLDGGQRVVVLEDGSEVHARCVLVASGVDYRRLDVPGLGDYEGAGIYYAATDMEARLCRGDDVVVVGGGNSAGQAIVFLARYARTVHVVIRGDDLGKNMSRYLVDRVEGIPNVRVHRGCVVDVLEGSGHLNAVMLRTRDGREQRVETPALFLFIGAQPRTGWLSGCVEVDRKGFVLTGDAVSRDALTADAWRAVNRTPFFLETSLPGVFAAGDVRAGSAKRVAAAVGEGSMAVSFVHAHVGAI